MELVMKRPMSFFETLQKLFPQKGRNIVYEEEGILGKGISLPSALKQIQHYLLLIVISHWLMAKRSKPKNTHLNCIIGLKRPGFVK